MFGGLKIPPKYNFFKIKSQNFDFQKLCGTTALLHIHPVKICKRQFSHFSSEFSVNFEPSNNILYIQRIYFTVKNIILAFLEPLIFGGTPKISIFYDFSAF